MKFFDNKQEVIDIKLTQKGRKLLSEGKFKPKYYSLHDTNVIYDGEYAGVSETQNDIEGRIQSDTPTLRTQYNFTSRDTQKGTDLLSDLININEVQFQTPISRKAGLGTEKAPRWVLQMYDGKITGATGSLSGSNKLTTPITQLDLTMKYRVRPYLASETDVISDFNEPENVYSLSDGSYLLSFTQDVLIDLNEEHTPYEAENFEVEVFKVETVGTQTKLRKLNFVQRPIYVVDGELLDSPMLPPADLEIDNSFVEYYFDFTEDSAIPESALCKAVKKLKARGIYLDSEFECPEQDSPLFPDIYGTNIEDSDIEDCE